MIALTEDRFTTLTVDRDLKVRFSGDIAHYFLAGRHLALCDRASIADTRPARTGDGGKVCKLCSSRRP